MANYKSDLIDVEGQIIYDKPEKKAILFKWDDNKEAVWLPRSQIEYVKKPSSKTLWVVTLPQWLAERNDML